MLMMFLNFCFCTERLMLRGFVPSKLLYQRAFQRIQVQPRSSGVFVNYLSAYTFCFPVPFMQRCFCSSKAGEKTPASEVLYDQIADRYESWFDRHSAVFQSEIESLRKVIPKSGKGLEIGVGSGRFAAALGIAFGVDPSPKMLQFAQSRGINVTVGVAENLPFPDGEFDYVLLCTVLCYLKDPLKGLLEAKRVLKPGGSLIIGMIDPDSALGRDYEARKKENPFYRDAYFQSVSEVLTLLGQIKFKEKQVYQTLFAPIKNIETIEPVIPGYGEGGFVVIEAQERRPLSNL